MLHALLAALLAFLPSVENPKPLKILFLGDRGHHEPAERFRQLERGLAGRHITLEYTDNLDALKAETLNKFDGLIIYANHTSIKPEQEKALLDFVEQGKGFIPLHCASYCFLNSPKYVDLVGAQFQRHGTGVFRVERTNAKDALLNDFSSFESWDETYVHTKHNEKDRTVLEYRKEGDKKEPWTWIRTQGQGRVFYTAWGHDERTWTHPGFLNLVERGIRWACKADPESVPAYLDAPKMTEVAKDAKPFEYTEAKVPYYPPSRTWGVTAEPLNKMQKPLSPEESMKHIVHPEGFELKLFVEETDLGGKPICMNWDEQGRLWVAVTQDYPNDKQTDGQGHDKIIICEDTKGAGRADKFTVFADKLSIPTSFVFSRGGVIVHAPPHTLFLKDNTGSGHADERRILFTGWSTSDTHAGPSNLVYGHDNWIYGIVGYAGFEGTIGGQHHRFAQGFYRFKPDGSAMEFLRNTSNNSWGVGFSEEGCLFGSTANGCPSVYLPIPNRYYEAVRGWSSTVLRSIALSNQFHPITDKVRQVDYHGGFTAAAGHALYTARTYPKEYWNRVAFVCEPTGHLCAAMVLQPNGTDFIARYGWNLVASDDEWCAPVAAEVGPDGNVWIIDWYAFIVQHNPTPPGHRTGKGNAYETNLRDKTHGRIYRLVYTGAKPKPLPNLKDAPPEKLVETLRNDNLFWRRHAQRLLVERGKKDVAADLWNILATPKVDEAGLDVGAIHALWTLHELGSMKDPSTAQWKSISSALKLSSPPSVRRAAIQVLPVSSESAYSFVVDKLFDADPQVRLAVLLFLSESQVKMPHVDAPGLLLADLITNPEWDQNLKDRWLVDAITCAAARHDYKTLGWMLAGTTEPKDPKALHIVRTVAEHYARGQPSADLGELLALHWSNTETINAVLQGIGKGWPVGYTVTLSDENQEAVAKLYEKLPAASRGTLVRLARAWGVKQLTAQTDAIAKQLKETIQDGKKTERERIAAANEFAELTPDQAATLFELISAKTPPTLAAGLIEAAGKNLAGDAARAVLTQSANWPPTARQVLLRTLIAKAETARVLLATIEAGKLQFTELPLDQRQSLIENPDRRIAGQARRLLAAGGGLPNPDRQKVIDEFLPNLKKTGNAALGKAVFAKHCAICHRHGEEGADVGPNLTGLNVHPKEHLIVDILDPSRSVEGNFRSWNVLTKDGKLHQGMLASETRTTLELVDTQGKRSTLQREDVDELAATNKSLMPEGFEKQVSTEDIVNLLEFLTQRGKYLPLPLHKAATIVSTRGMFFDEASRAERLIFPDWKPKTFNGVPFLLVDPQEGKTPNVVLLYGPQGQQPPKMPKSVRLDCEAPAKAIHFLSGVSGWGFPYSEKGSVSMIVRLVYADGQTEDHELQNGVQFADYIRRVDVPGSQFAFNLGGKQVRYFSVAPKRQVSLKAIELRKGPDDTAPIVVAVTVETP